ERHRTPHGQTLGLFCVARAPSPASLLQGPRVCLSSLTENSSLLGSNPQSFHLPVEMAALQAQDLGSAADVAVVLIELFQDVVPFVGGAGLMQGREFAARGATSAIPMDQGRQVFAVETHGSGIHDDNAFDHIA